VLTDHEAGGSARRSSYLESRRVLGCLAVHHSVSAGCLEVASPVRRAEPGGSVPSRLCHTQSRCARVPVVIGSRDHVVQR
jgi:hypothetical protein